jgi:hypothetical protein
LHNFSAWSRADEKQGVADIRTECFAMSWTPIDVGRASAFVGHDFAVPAGPTKYKATLHYDWNCDGVGAVAVGVVVVNVDLAIVIDKRDGSRETYAREVSLLTIPFAGSDRFLHYANDVRVTIPFARDGSKGTVRIMVGADGTCTSIAPFPWAGNCGFNAKGNSARNLPHLRQLTTRKIRPRLCPAKTTPAALIPEVNFLGSVSVSPRNAESPAEAGLSI